MADPHQRFIVALIEVLLDRLEQKASTNANLRADRSALEETNDELRFRLQQLEREVEAQGTSLARCQSLLGRTEAARASWAAKYDKAIASLALLGDDMAALEARAALPVEGEPWSGQKEEDR